MTEEKYLKIVISKFDKLGKEQTKNLSQKLDSPDDKLFKQSLNMKNWKRNHQKLSEIVDVLTTKIKNVNSHKEQTREGQKSQALITEKLTSRLSIAQRLLARLDLLKQVDEAETREICTQALQEIGIRDYAVFAQACKIAKKKIDAALVLDGIVHKYPIHTDEQSEVSQELAGVIQILTQREKESDIAFEKLKSMRSLDDEVSELPAKVEQKQDKSSNIHTRKSRLGYGSDIVVIPVKKTGRVSVPNDNTSNRISTNI